MNIFGEVGKVSQEAGFAEFRVCYKNDLKNGISGFGIEFPSDEKTDSVT